MKVTSSVCIAVLMLAGCTGELYRPIAELWAKDWRAADDAKCRNLGFKPGTDAYRNCRLQVEQIRATGSVAATARTK